MIDTDAMQDITVERALIAAIIRDNAVLDKLGVLKPEHFYDLEMREVFSTACDLHAEGRPVNLVTLPALMGSDPLGGATISDRLRAVTFEAGAEPTPRDMAASLIDLAQRRELIALCEMVGGFVTDFTKKPAALAEQLVREGERMLTSALPAGQTYWTAPEAMDEALDRLARDISADRIPTGIRALDKITGGMHRKHIVYLAARTSVGKTALAIAAAVNAARAGHGVLYLSMEMALQDIEARIASMATYDRRHPQLAVPYARAVNQNLTAEENERFVRAGIAMGKLPITIEERPNLSTADIALLVRRTAQDFSTKRQRLGVVIVDLLGKVRPRDPKASVFDQLTQVSRDLTALAKSENVAMLVLHQLNREVESRENKRPRKSDLRGSGSLEEDADGIWMLFREGYYEQRSDTETAEEALARQLRLEHKMEIIVADVFCALECNVIEDDDNASRARFEAATHLEDRWRQRCARCLVRSRANTGLGKALRDRPAPSSQAAQHRAGRRLRNPISSHRSNIAVACGEASNIVVVDVDPRNGGDGSIRALNAKGHSFPTGPRARTGNGGWHLLYRHQPGIRGSKGKLGPGIDVKSSGGYILVAPSWTKKSSDGPGGFYTWEVSPFDASVPRLPIWMTAILCPPPRPTPSYAPDIRGGDVEPLARFVEASTKGERNDRLHWAACRAGEMASRHQVSAQSAGNRLVAAAAAAGYVGGEVVRTIDSGFKQSGLRFEANTRV